MVEEKNVLNEELNMEKILGLNKECYELDDVNDLAWYFIKGKGSRWIIGAY